MLPEVKLAADFILSFLLVLARRLLIFSSSSTLVSRLSVTLYNSFTAPTFSMNIRSCEQRNHDDDMALKWIFTAEIKSCVAFKSGEFSFREIYVGNTIELTRPCARSFILKCVGISNKNSKK